MHKRYGRVQGFRVQAFAAMCAGLLLGWTVSASAVTLTNGFLSVSNGMLFATNQFSTGNFSISYNVSQVGTQVTYTYTLFVPLKSLSHWLLQVSTNFTAADLISESGTGTFTSTTPSLWTPNTSNDGMPTNLFGYKFDTGGVSPTGTLTFTIVTDRLPTNGNFYARDGNGVYAYNTGFANPSTGAFLIVPDSVAVVPEPSSIFLVTGGVLMMMLATRRRR
jgi:hypothetical protein